VWHLRNIGRGAPPSVHSNAEIAPPMEGLSSSLRLPAERLSGLISRPLGFTMIHSPATSLGIKDKSRLRVDSRAMY
jgi:hypothetical protein